LGVLVVPTGLALVWFGIFGGNAIHLELNAPGGVGTAGIIELVRGGNYEGALYATIDRMSDADWLAWAMSAMATLLLATWFITSSDSGTLVITTLLSMGDPHPPRRFRIVWGLGVGAVAAVLLLADGLQALQTAAIAAALPVSVVLLFMIAGLLRSLARDP
ncbi:MAG: BCCT family transporter, partial [Gemmatimonadales bacterium]|nr:BCCT family transporter [Gemmatimonadales bacterium]